uniref:Uncharacterized protein n=1 Tax=Compsopogon caeruleus TaxID=31354 RepID=A0A1Z1XB33_9RHOD|nr:hypothetical protein [Compsopogon caeruleus]ARX96026.1 hypothetical protein [Compsopogon caeruleus]
MKYLKTIKKMNLILNDLLYKANYKYVDCNSNTQCKTIINRKFNIKGINNPIWQNEIKTIFNLNELEKIQGEMTQTDISYLINNLSASGFFEGIQLKTIIISNIQIITLKLKLNPLLLNINFLSNSNLLIPQNLLIDYFSDQIGYPKSLKKIHNSIQSIYNWYHKHGFKWVKIEIKNSHHSNNSIDIKISEGIINSIQFKNSLLVSNIISLSSYKQLINCLRKNLNLEEDELINENKIEKSIDFIKNKNIVDNCEYKVIFSNKYLNKVDIIIHVYSLPDKVTYLIGKNITLTTDLIDTIEANLFNSINRTMSNYIWNNLQKHSIKIAMNNINIASKINSFLLYTYNHNLIDIIKSIINDRKSHIFIELYEWYISPTRLNTNNSIKLRQYIRNLGKQQEYFHLDLEIPTVNQEFYSTLYFPWLYFFKKSSSELQLKILQYFEVIKNSPLTELLNQFTNSNFLLNNSILKIKSIEIILKHLINNNIETNTKISTNIINNKYNIIKSQEYKQKILNSKYQYKYTPKPCVVYRIKKNMSYEYIRGSLDLKYKSYKNHSNIYQYKQFYIQLISDFFLPLKIFNFNLSKLEYSKFTQKLILKSTFYIKQQISKIENHQTIFISNIEIGSLLGSATLLPPIEDFCLTIPNSIRGYNETYISLPKTFYKINLEYHKPFTNINNFFIFFDYTYIIARKSKFINSDITKVLFSNNYLDKSKINSSTGIGLQVKLSIKQIPAIRLEYGINISKEIHSHLRVSPEFNIN